MSSWQGSRMLQAVPYLLILTARADDTSIRLEAAKALADMMSHSHVARLVSGIGAPVAVSLMADENFPDGRIQGARMVARLRRDACKVPWHTQVQ